MDGNDDQIRQIVSQYLKKINPEMSEMLSDNISGLFSSQKLKEIVVEGSWDELVDKLTISKNNEIVDKSIFKIIEQKIHETLAKGNQTLALEILRKELSPRKRFPDRVHQLAQNILLMKPEPVDRDSFAQELIAELKRVPGLMITEARLEELIQQAVEYQKTTNCPYHFERNDDSNLWYDHDCKINETIVLEPESVNAEIIPIQSAMDILQIFTSPDSKHLLVFDGDGNIFLYKRAEHGGWIFTVKMTTESETMTIWPNSIDNFPQSLNQGQVLFKTVQNFNAPCGQISAESPLAMAFMPDQNFVIIGLEDQTTTLFDIREGTPIHSWIRLRCSHIVTPNTVVDKYFLALSDSGNILQISTETFQVLKTIPPVNDKLLISSIDLDGKRLLVGCNDSTIYFYDDWLNYPQPTRIFRGHKCKKFQITSILSRFDPNIVISGSENGSIYLWNLSSGRLLFQIKIFPDNCCVNDILEIEPKSFICCGDGGKLYQFSL